MTGMARRPGALALVLLAALSGPAAAQSGSANEAQAAARRACRGDFQRLCQGVQPGGGRPLRCLEEHRAELGPDCRTALDAAKQAGGRPGG